ncbi:response regulator transcription factor [Paraburkholderia sp. 35.1]|uniref:response regulator transcription factor n=1 Tax=unclassified Paraburkholderia TaxID=2615204 RepID=UPI003D1BF9DB
MRFQQFESLIIGNTAVSTILVVGDDPNILTALRFLLEPEGYHVLTAQNGEAALAAAGIESPALVVTDWKMPRLDGVELCWRLRRSRATAGILLVMAAGTLAPPLAGRPWDVFLLKPVQAVCLLNAIRGLLLQVSSDTNASR